MMATDIVKLAEDIDQTCQACREALTVKGIPIDAFGADASQRAIAWLRASRRWLKAARCALEAK